MKKRSFRVEVTLLHAEPRYIALALHLPVLGEVCLHLDVRGSNKAGFQIACEDDVLLLRSEKENDQDVPGKPPGLARIIRGPAPSFDQSGGKPPHPRMLPLCAVTPVGHSR